MWIWSFCADFLCDILRTAVEDTFIWSKVVNIILLLKNMLINQGNDALGFLFCREECKQTKTKNNIGVWNLNEKQHNNSLFQKQKFARAVLSAIERQHAWGVPFLHFASRALLFAPILLYIKFLKNSHTHHKEVFEEWFWEKKNDNNSTKNQRMLQITHIPKDTCNLKIILKCTKIVLANFNVWIKYWANCCDYQSLFPTYSHIQRMNDE